MVIDRCARWHATLAAVLGCCLAGCSSEASSPYGTAGSGGHGAGTSTTSATSSGGGGAASWLGEVVPDFGLMDVNPTSASYDTAVSPRDYLEQVSGWFFGAAT